MIGWYLRSTPPSDNIGPVRMNDYEVDGDDWNHRLLRREPNDRDPMRFDTEDEAIAWLNANIMSAHISPAFIRGANCPWNTYWRIS